MEDQTKNSRDSPRHRKNSKERIQVSMYSIWRKRSNEDQNRELREELTEDK